MSGEDHSTYEPQGPSYPLMIAAGVSGFILFTALAMAGLYLFYLPAARNQPFKVTEFAEPRLQIDPSKDLAEAEAKQSKRLDRTAWTGPDKTHLVIPIDAAMKAVAARGQNAYAPLPDAPRDVQGGRPPGAMAPNGRRFNPGAGDSDQMREPK